MIDRKKIGVFSSAVIETLHLNIPVGTPIYIAESNIQHMKNSHPKDYAKYGNYITHIILLPDYVGHNAKDNSIEFTKEFPINDEFVKVAVRVSSRNVYYVRSLYILNPKRVQNFIKKGTLKSLTNRGKYI